MSQGRKNLPGKAEEDFFTILPLNSVTCGISQFIPPASGGVFASPKPGIIIYCTFSLDRGVGVPQFRPWANSPLILKVKALGCFL